MKSPSNPHPQVMNSMASAYQFNPHDPRYYQCCCCARLHVQALAKAVALICIFSNVISIWGVVAKGTDLKLAVWMLIGSGVMAVAVFQEHRPTLILLLILQGLSIASAALLLIILTISMLMGNVGFLSGHQLGPLVYVGVAFSIGLVFWSFAVMLHFFSFLTDRERAGAVAVMYESRPQQPQARAGPPHTYGEHWKAPRKSHDGHIPYPIYPAQRTPSLTPAPSPAPAPVVVVVENQDPPAYEIEEEKEQKERKDSVKEENEKE